MSLQIRIRPYRLPEDIDGLAQVFVDSERYHATIDDLPPLTPPISIEYARNRFARIEPDDTRGLFVAEVDGAVVGHIEVSIRRNDEVGFVGAYVDELAVAGGWRGRGIGTALMAHGEAWAKGNGAKSIMLDHLHTNAGAAKLYQRLGFRRRGILLGKRF
jgi:ribosomal protein S18 acetylase RimI-like enzyme